MALKRKKEMLQKDSYYEDIVEQLNLGLTDEVQKSLVQDITAEMQFKSPESFAPTLASLIRNICPVLDPFQMCLNIGEIATSSDQLEQEQNLSPSERALVDQYRTKHSVPPSSVTWNVLIGINYVALPIEDFIARALRNEQTSQQFQLELGKLRSVLEPMKNCDYVNEPLLSAAFASFFGVCTALLQVKFTGIFGFRVQAPLPDQKCHPDFTIVHSNLQATEETRTVLLVAEVKTVMPASLLCVDQEFYNGLAQLIYSGIRVARSQNDFMPLMVLTSGDVWHFFEVDKTGRPTRYSKVAHTGVASAALVSLTACTEFDATAVLSEILAFVQRNEDHLK